MGNDDERLNRIAVIANSLNISFKEAEQLVSRMGNELIHPDKIQIYFETMQKAEPQSKSVIDEVTESIVSRTIREFNLYFQISNKGIDAFRNSVKDEIEKALKNIKVADVIEIRKENEKLREAYIGLRNQKNTHEEHASYEELIKDRKRLKSALQSAVCGIMTYADTKGSAAAVERLSFIINKACESLRDSDMVTDLIVNK